MKEVLSKLGSSIFGDTDKQHQFTVHKIVLVSTILYFLSNIAILLVHGVFWDDWCLYNNEAGIKEITTGIGATWQYPLHMGLLNLSKSLSIDVVFLYRFVILLLGYIDVILFTYILKQIRLDISAIAIAAFVYAVWPLGFAHMLMCCFVYQVGMLFLMVSICLLLVENKKIYHTVSMLVSVFLASMFLQSAIVYWFGCICLWLYRENKNTIKHPFIYQLLRNRKNIEAFVYFLPCLLYWIIRKIYWAPTGEYAADGYNAITIKNIILYPIKLVWSLGESVIFYAEQYTILSKVGLVLFVLTIIVVLFLLKTNTLYRSSKKVISLNLLIVLYLMGITAHLLVGKVPAYEGAEDRFAQLLTPFYALVTAFILESFFVSSIKKYVVAIALSLLCVHSNLRYIDSIQSSQINDSIVQYFRTEVLPEGNVLVCDESSFGEKRFYEISGLYHKATGKQDRCFFTTGIVEKNDSFGFLSEMYNQKDAKAGKPKVLFSFKVKQGETLMALMKRQFYFLTNRDKYYKFLDNLDINVCKIEDYYSTIIN